MKKLSKSISYIVQINGGISVNPQNVYIGSISYFQKHTLILNKMFE